jgi:hypothetical protein
MHLSQLYGPSWRKFEVLISLHILYPIQKTSQKNYNIIKVLLSASFQTQKIANSSGPLPNPIQQLHARRHHATAETAETNTNPASFPMTVNRFAPSTVSDHLSWVFPYLCVSRENCWLTE